MPPIRLEFFYGQDQAKPYRAKIILTTESNRNGTVTPYHWHAGSYATPLDSYEWATAIAETMLWNFLAQGVDIFRCNAALLDATTGVPSDEWEQPFEKPNGGAGQFGGGPSDRVLGFKARVQGSRAVSIFAFGGLKDSTAPINNGQNIATLNMPDLTALRIALNQVGCFAVSRAQSVNRTLVPLSNFSNGIYHGVRRG